MKLKTALALFALADMITGFAVGSQWLIAFGFLFGAAVAVSL
jgi:hypothetical protein